MEIFFAVVIAVWLVNGLAGGLLFVYDIWTHCRYQGINPPFIAYLHTFGTGLLYSLRPFHGLKFVWEGINAVSNPNRHKERESTQRKWANECLCNYSCGFDYFNFFKMVI